MVKKLKKEYVKNNLLLAVFSILFVALSGLSAAAEVRDASLYFSPASQGFEITENFSVEVFLDSGFTDINAAQVIIYFPADKLEVISLTKDNSIFSLWPEEPSFDNNNGRINFAGGLPTPGFRGQGKIITIEFRGKERGDFELNFGEAKILADDGQGTNILTYLKKAKYFIFEERPSAEIFSLTHLRQDEWYNNDSPLFEWLLNKDIKKVSFTLDKNPETMPDGVSEGLIQSTKYYGLADGVWYFHLRLADDEGWLEASHYKVQIDTFPPASFEIAVDNSGDQTNPQPNLCFETFDETSGVNNYRIKIDQADFFDLMLAQIGSVPLSLLKPGSHRIVVRAIDQAGNITQAESVINIEPLETPQIIVWQRKYVAGEEVLYLHGQTLPNLEVIISLRDEIQEKKRWQIKSNEQGEWFFSTKELIKPGKYSLSVMVRDERGAVSNYSEEKIIEVFFNGIILGPLMVAFKSLALVFSILLATGLVLMLYLFSQNRRNKKILTKETLEAEKSLKENFNSLEKEIIKRIEMIDSQPGFNEKEKTAYEHIKSALLASKEKIEKEIKDIKNLLQ